MAFVVTEACIQCKYTDCVEVCPMECFVEGPNFLAINPDECIDCSICVPQCPVNAIFPANEVPDDQVAFVELNRVLAQQAGWQRIRHARPPLPGHEQWAKVKDKRALLKR
nr:ferredoxin FdxA [uncultured Caldimonas sp.]